MPNYAAPPFDPKIATQLKKPRPRLLDKYDRASARDKTDREERAKVRTRSGGRCEVWTTVEALFVFDPKTMRPTTLKPGQVIVTRCKRTASENHHLIGGSGRRNRGKSILAAHRLHVCARCHQEITGKVLVPIDGTQKEDAATVRYERIR